MLFPCSPITANIDSFAELRCYSIMNYSCSSRSSKFVQSIFSDSTTLDIIGEKATWTYFGGNSRCIILVGKCWLLALCNEVLPSSQHATRREPQGE